MNTQIKMEKNNLLQESLKRHRELLGYDPSKGTSSLNERSRHTYLADDIDYAEGDEEETKEGCEEEGGDNPDFDFVVFVVAIVSFSMIVVC